MSIFESQLGNPGFVQLTQAVRDHPVVLPFRRAGERKIETEAACEFQSSGTRAPASISAPLALRQVARPRMIADLQVS